MSLPAPRPSTCAVGMYHYVRDVAATSSPALLTFDDGVRDHAEIVMPRLQARGLSAVFFISGDTVRPRPCVLNVHKVSFLVAYLGGEALLAAVAATLSTTPDRRRHSWGSP